MIARIPYSWIGDKLYSFNPPFSTESLAVGAVKGAVTGNYLGKLNIIEDDPIPTLSVVSNNVTAKEGNSLRWQLRLSTPTTGAELSCFLMRPRGKELSSRDVPESWLESLFVTLPISPLPLSNLGIIPKISFPYGVQSASIVVPIAPDGKAENKESMVCEIFDFQGGIITLVGKVPRHV